MNHDLPRLSTLLSVLLYGILAGCQNPKAMTPPATLAASQTARITQEARAANARGADLLTKGKPEEAEKAFKEALTLDPAFGPAHNNLGRVYFERADLYQAAWEFQYAAKVLPHAAEPQNNLGMVFETANKLPEAIDAYAKAVSLAPDHLEYVGNLARARIRHGDRSEELRQLLQRIVDGDTRAEWTAWAREQLAISGHPK